MIFLCDMQERFKTKIRHFDHVTNMSEKLLKSAIKLNVPILATEQYPKALGNTIDSLSDLVKNQPKGLHEPTQTVPIYSKTSFSMLIDEVKKELSLRPIRNVGLIGIESHVCILQTCLDLLKDDLQVYVLADAVSSCNAQERGIALQTIRDAGGVVSTTESFIYGLLGDANHPNAKEVFGIVKEYNEKTKNAVEALGNF